MTQTGTQKMPAPCGPSRAGAGAASHATRAAQPYYYSPLEAMDHDVLGRGGPTTSAEACR